MNKTLKIVLGCFIVIFAYLLITNFFLAFKLPPAGGDSYWYHVPIARNILSGNFISQKGISGIEVWYPGASEGILALFILLHLPVNLFNVFGIFIFSLVLYNLGNKYLNNRVLSLIYAISFVISYGVFRLIIMQNIDIWFAIYFLLLMILFEKQVIKNIDFLFIGLFSGLLIGSKYTGPLFLLVLIIVYFKKLIAQMSIKKLIIALIPFTLFGLFWYIRNLLLTGSPFYPQSFLFFKGLNGWHSYLLTPVWKSIVYTPKLMLDVLVSEFMIWPGLFLLTMLLILYFKFLKKRSLIDEKTKRLLLISFLIVLVYLFLPYDGLYLGMVLSMRYIYTFFAIIGLLVFIIAKKLKIELIISITLLFSSFILFYNPYHPKLVYLYCPIIFIILLVFSRKNALFQTISQYTKRVKIRKKK